MLIAECSKQLSNCCHDPGIISLVIILKNILDIIQIVVPIILIVFLTIHLVKMAMNPEMKNGFNKFKNMSLATIMVFIMPVLVNAVVDLMPQSFEVASCWNLAGGKDEIDMASSHKYIKYQKGDLNPLMSKVDDYEIGEEREYGSKKAKAAGNTSDEYVAGLKSGDASGILDGCEKVHTMYEQQHWFYYTSLDQLRWNDVKYSTNNPSKATCCATFVGSAFLVGGVFTEAEINQFNYNSQFGISDLCQAHGWIKITNYASLKAGDVVIMTGPGSGGQPGHVQVYAGNGTWYNAGGNESISGPNPYPSDASAGFLWAWRKPA